MFQFLTFYVQKSAIAVIDTRIMFFIENGIATTEHSKKVFLTYDYILSDCCKLALF